MAATPTKAVTAACHCKQQSFTAAIPVSSLPLNSRVCHCDSCRRSSGCLNTSAAPWPDALPDNHTLKTQKVFWLVKDVNKLTVFTACLPHEKGIVRYTDHIYVGDTIDGGLSSWLLSPHFESAKDSMPISRWKDFDGKSEKLSVEWPGVAAPAAEDELTGGDRLPIRCRCGGVNLELTRPDYTNSKSSEVPWWVDPDTRRKWLAVICPCDSCRLTFSSDMVPLSFVDMKNVHAASGVGSTFPSNVVALSEAVARGDPALGTLAKYQSSKEAFRFHCTKCSASIFYACDDRPELLDLAVGVIHSPDGARAEGMLWWKCTTKSTISHVADIEGGWREELHRGCLQERRQWRVKRGWKLL
ncbi:hypothetical protein FH972_026510 [Carpinus fangiana]|uniref:CENP-V/GFA domain-containing protein n=1 Tax=Carpinus fangiana TaxID=176857 RepID=A0A5N6L487_9ROSI|nr:hypothetical protein FH972_026510 [Carpinus fangiana]